jgi:hypothetical protein
MKYSFIFISQSGALEFKSILLALSLREMYADDCQLIAAVPTPTHVWGSINKTTQKIFQTLKVEIREICNPISDSYPIANKISAFQQPTNGDLTIFLDTDILCLKPLTRSEWKLQSDFAVRPAGGAWSKENESLEWEKVYALFGLQLPNERVIGSISNLAMIPYFNAGVIITKDNQILANKWLECALKIDSQPTISNKRPWLDQIALPVAMYLLGGKIQVLPDEFNFPASRKKFPSERLPFFVHYHELKTIPKISTLRQKIIKIINSRKLYYLLAFQFPRDMYSILPSYHLKLIDLAEKTLRKFK